MVEQPQEDRQSCQPPTPGQLIPFVIAAEAEHKFRTCRLVLAGARQVGRPRLGLLKATTVCHNRGPPCNGEQQ
eukprot:2283546-Pyramimonas_sp.AAC.1